MGERTDKPVLIAFEVTAPKVGRTDEHFAGGAATLVAQLAQIDISALSTSISGLVDELAAAFKPRVGGPASCEVEFGLKVTAEGNIIVSKLGGEISIGVKVAWDRG